MAPEDFPTYKDLVAQARNQWAGRIDVRLGIESDYFPGFEPWLEKLHADEDLEYVLGSVHHHMDYYINVYAASDATEFRKRYFEMLAASAESGLFDCLAHPDLVKNHEPKSWSFSKLHDVIARALDRIASTGVAMELNTSGRLKTYPEMNPSLAQLQMMNERGIPVVLGSDAHGPARVADYFPQALELLLTAGYKTVSYFVGRKRREISLTQALQSLKSAQKA